MTQMKESLFVLFTAPYHQVASGVCYIALDGFPTILKSEAARFQSFVDAKAFAKEHRIALNGLAYIGLDGFTDVEPQSSGMSKHSGSDRRTHQMTMLQAAVLQMKWKQRTDHMPCEHLNLELAWDILGHSDGSYVCTHCGETVAQRSLAA
jgi:hypothetical protein